MNTSTEPLTDQTPKRLGEDAIHQALHSLDVRIPGLKVGGCHCNLITQVVLDALAPAIGQLQAELAAWQERESADAAAGSYALRAETAEAERNDLHRRIADARAEIRRQDVAAQGTPFSDVTDALAAVETHLVAPEYRPEQHFSPGYRGELPDHPGSAGACAMTACVTARARHEAVADAKDLTRDMYADNARGGAS